MGCTALQADPITWAPAYHPRWTAFAGIWPPPDPCGKRGKPDLGPQHLVSCLCRALACLLLACPTATIKGLRSARSWRARVMGQRDAFWRIDASNHRRSRSDHGSGRDWNGGKGAALHFTVSCAQGGGLATLGEHGSRFANAPSPRRHPPSAEPRFFSRSSDKAARLSPRAPIEPSNS